MRTAAACVIAVAGFAACSENLFAQAWEPAKDSAQAFGGVIEPGRIIVQFKRGSAARAVEGRLTGVPQVEGARPLPAGRWARLHTTADAELNLLRTLAEASLGVALPDLTLTFDLRLNDGQDLFVAIDALRGRADVEYALPSCPPVPPPLPPSYVSSQRYLDAATNGIGASLIWTWPGGTGAGIRVCDLEYSWNTSHQDLPAVTRLGAVGSDPFNDTGHGTAVLGEMLSLNNGWGTTGAVYGAEGFIAPTYFSTGYNLPGAITTASAGLRAGDVMLIEQQWLGPHGGPGYVPVEWYKPNYDAIRQAVGAGRVVVEAAGNGSENLDAAIFSTGNGGHWPFLAANDSGALIVGAGAAPAANGGSTTDRSRLSFSCYGSTVDLQGWGERVYSCGYGSLYSAEGVNLYYTSGFSGTSSASPIVASACVALQSVYKSVTGGVLPPAQVKALLQSTGSPQQAGANPVSQNIGPRPDVASAIAAVFGNRDCNGNSRPDAIDIAMGSSPDVNSNGVPDECDPHCTGDFNGDTFVDAIDYDAFVTAWLASAGASDINSDGFSDAIDYDLFISHWIAGC